MVILALPEQNNQCTLLWELMGNRRTEERDGSETYLKKILTKKIDTVKKKNQIIFEMMWNGIRENSQQKKPLALMKDWAFLLQQSCHADRKTYPQFSGELLITSGQTCMRWNRTFLKCFNSSSAVWVLRNDPVHLSDLSNLRPYSKLWFRGHCHGLQWNSPTSALFQTTKEFLGMRWASICLLQLSLPLSLLLTLLRYHLGCLLKHLCSPVARFDGHGYREKVWHYLFSSDSRFVNTITQG